MILSFKKISGVVFFVIFLGAVFSMSVRAQAAGNQPPLRSDEEAGEGELSSDADADKALGVLDEGPRDMTEAEKKAEEILRKEKEAKLLDEMQKQLQQEEKEKLHRSVTEDRQSGNR